MKIILKKIIGLFGLEIRRKQRSVINKNNNSLIAIQPHRNTMGDALNFIKSKGFYPNTIIDVGAGNGTLPLLTIFPKAKHLLFEPLAEFAPELELLKSNYNLDFYICAIGLSASKVSINVHDDIYGSSLLNEEDGIIANGKPREVEMMTLHAVNELCKLTIDNSLLIKLDVQGAELHVLKSGEEVLSKADVVIIECSFFKFLKDAPEITDIIFYMKHKGFVLYEMFDFHNRPYDNALAQVDAIFVKENGLLRKSHNWATHLQREAANN